jgi:hypothetical protein
MKSDSLIFCGEHPAAGWLAVYLAQRGWELAWADGPRRQDPLALSHALFEPLGETVPAWPLEWCSQQLDGLALYQNGELELLKWPAAVLDTQAIWIDLDRDMTRLGIRREAASLLVADQARLGEFEAKWCIEISSGECQAGCQQRQRQGSLNQAVTGGMLETLSTEADRLCLAALGPAQSLFSYRLNGAADRWPLLCAAWPEMDLPLESPLLPACACLPIWQQQDRHLRLLIPRSSLQPEAMLAESLIWLSSIALGRWLGEEWIVLDRLAADLDSYLQKVKAVLASLGKMHNFLDIRI